ncbi:MAG: hypothetical protein JXR07_17335 [Reichenbachiella sp.]
MKSYIYTLVILSMTLFILSSCDDDDPTIPNEEELITTVILELEDSQGNHFDFSFEDLDGAGGDSPVITTPTLAANTSYHAHIEFLNKLAEVGEHEEEDEGEDEHGHSHGENVNEEILEEAEDHQVFYILSSSVDAIVEYEDDDLDMNGNPIGLEATFTTGDASTGTLTVVLRHEPKKPNDGTLADAGGETDIEVEFDFTVE